MDALKLNMSFGKEVVADVVTLDRLFSPYPHKLNIGDCRILPITAPGGDGSILDNLPRHQPFQFTKFAQQAPKIKKIVDMIPAPALSVRLLKFPPNTGVLPHADNCKSFRHGILRLHVPIQTGEQTIFRISEKHVNMGIGDLWYGDFTKMHSFVNKNSFDVIHLVADVRITPELMSLFPQDFRENLEETEVFYDIPEKKGASPGPKGRLKIPSALLPLGLEQNHFLETELRPNDTAGRLDLIIEGESKFQLAPLSDSTYKICHAGHHLFTFSSNHWGTEVRIESRGFHSQDPDTDRFVTRDLSFNTTLR